MQAPQNTEPSGHCAIQTLSILLGSGKGLLSIGRETFRCHVRLFRGDSGEGGTAGRAGQGTAQTMATHHSIAVDLDRWQARYLGKYNPFLLKGSVTFNCRNWDM